VFVCFVNTNYQAMKKKIGRPTSEPESRQTHQLQMRVSAEFIAKLDKWRGAQLGVPSRTEAVRRLVERGLAADEAPAPKRGRAK
jgi:hypothetical protein